MKTQEETTTLSMLLNGECTDQNLLNQHLFIEKPDSQTLNIKFVGPGLLMIDSMYSPINKQALQQEGSTLVFGHNWYGWNDIENISTIATPYIAQHNITKLNIILQMHGFVEDNSYYLGVEYDPTAICGAPKKVLSNQFINELSKLTNLVESTDLISIACYGKKMIELGDPEIIQQFSNTTFCFFSKDDVTWQGDICNGSHQLDSFFQSYNMSVMERCLLTYAMNVKEKLHVPHVIKAELEVNFSEILSTLYTSENIANNPFIQTLISTDIINSGKTEELLGNEIISAFPDISAPSFGAILGAHIFDYFHHEA